MQAGPNRLVVSLLVNRTGHVIIGLGAIMLVCHLAAVLLRTGVKGNLISGDAVHHFVQLRSVVYDRDLDFADEYTRIYLDAHPEGPVPDWHEILPTPTGHVRNFMPIGPAILWAPLYMLVSGALWLGAAAGWTQPPDGFEPVLELVPSVMGLGLATAGAWMAWRLAARLTDPASAAAGTLGIWLGSNALYYSLVAPSYSHAASMLASTMIVAHWIANRERWALRDACVSGLLVGVATLMRWQDALWIAVPIIESLRSPGRWPGRVALVGGAGLGALLAFSPQMVVWQVLYGSPLTVPQGGSFMEWSAPNPLAVLFAAKHGLFTWNPIVLLSVVGIVSLAGRDRSLAMPLGLVAVATWYVNAAVADWWAGEAFGARRFLSLFPLFVIGLAAWLQPALRTGRPWRGLVTAFLVVANLLFLFQYELFMHGRRDLVAYPDTSWADLWLVRFVLPFRVLARWIH